MSEAECREIKAIPRISLRFIRATSNFLEDKNANRLSASSGGRGQWGDGVVCLIVIILYNFWIGYLGWIEC